MYEKTSQLAEVLVPFLYEVDYEPVNLVGKHTDNEYGRYYGEPDEQSSCLFFSSFQRCNLMALL